jgi:hypothetical protein
MFSLYLESFTPAFCAEAPEAESVQDVSHTFPVTKVSLHNSILTRN